LLFFQDVVSFHSIDKSPSWKINQMKNLEFAWWTAKAVFWLVLHFLAKSICFSFKFIFPGVRHLEEVCWAAWNLNYGERRSYQVGSKVDDDEVVTLQSQRTNLLSFQKPGKVLILNFGSCT